jgi:hypothetical protein
LENETEETGNKKSKNWAHGCKPSGFQFTSLTEIENHWRNLFNANRFPDQSRTGKAFDRNHLGRTAQGSSCPACKLWFVESANLRFTSSAPGFSGPMSLI